MKKVINFSLATVFALSLALVLVVNQAPQIVFGGVPIANEYLSTTTSALSQGGDVVLTTYAGGLGSVVVTKAGSTNGNLEFYDATTTDIGARALTMSTSSLLMASLPNDLVAGTYTFDARSKYGIIMVNSVKANAGTTTVIYR